MIGKILSVTRLTEEVFSEKNSKSAIWALHILSKFKYIRLSTYIVHI